MKDNKFTIGSQWLTRGNWKAVVVSSKAKGSTNRMIVWHQEVGSNRDEGNIHIHLLDGRLDDCACDANNYDLIEPWKEPRKGEFDVLVLANEKGIRQVLETKDWGGCLCCDLGNFNKENIIASITVKWTEGEGL